MTSIEPVRLALLVGKACASARQAAMLMILVNCMITYVLVIVLKLKGSASANVAVLISLMSELSRGLMALYIPCAVPTYYKYHLGVEDAEELRPRVWYKLISPSSPMMFRYDLWNYGHSNCCRIRRAKKSYVGAEPLHLTSFRG